MKVYFTFGAKIKMKCFQFLESNETKADTGKCKLESPGGKLQTGTLNVIQTSHFFHR